MQAVAILTAIAFWLPLSLMEFLLSTIGTCLYVLYAHYYTIRNFRPGLLNVYRREKTFYTLPDYSHAVLVSKKLGAAWTAVQHFLRAHQPAKDRN